LFTLGDKPELRYVRALLRAQSQAVERAARRVLSSFEEHKASHVA
jgi:hypothetical protein